MIQAPLRYPAGGLPQDAKNIYFFYKFEIVCGSEVSGGRSCASARTRAPARRLRVRDEDGTRPLGVSPLGSLRAYPQGLPINDGSVKRLSARSPEGRAAHRYKVMFT
jgi:hypothetical protein